MKNKKVIWIIVIIAAVVALSVIPVIEDTDDKGVESKVSVFHWLFLKATGKA